MQQTSRNIQHFCCVFCNFRSIIDPNDDLFSTTVFFAYSPINFLSKLFIGFLLSKGNHRVKNDLFEDIGWNKIKPKSTKNGLKKPFFITFAESCRTIYIYFNYAQKANRAVLSGICCRPTLQVTVIGITPIFSPPCQQCNLKASNGRRTIFSSIGTATIVPSCSYFRELRCPNIFTPLRRELARISFN